MATETNRAAEIRARLEAINGFQIVCKEVRTIREPLTPEQMVTVAQEMAEHLLKANQIEEEKKLITKKLKDQMDEENATATALAQTYEKGYEDNESDVFVVADFSAKVRRVFSIKTGLQVAQEVIQDRDFQGEMKLKPRTEKPATPTQEPVVGEARMAGEDEVIVMRNPERIALGFERDNAEGGTTTEDGSVIEDADYEVVSEAKKSDAPVAIELVTQIRSIEKKAKVSFLNTAEGLVLFTENQTDVDDAQININLNQAGKEKGESFYVEIKYIETDTRNKQLVSIKERIVPQTGEDPTEPVAIKGDGFDIGNGIDLDAEAPDADPDAVTIDDEEPE